MSERICLPNLSSSSRSSRAGARKDVEPDGDTMSGRSASGWPSHYLSLTRHVAQVRPELEYLTVFALDGTVERG